MLYIEKKIKNNQIRKQRLAARFEAYLSTQQMNVNEELSTKISQESFENFFLFNSVIKSLKTFYKSKLQDRVNGI